MTSPRLFSEHSLQNENKHQIMNVHTKWNCLILILSSVASFSDENISYIFFHVSTKCKFYSITFWHAISLLYIPDGIHILHESLNMFMNTVAIGSLSVPDSQYILCLAGLRGSANNWHTTVMATQPSYSNNLHWHYICSPYWMFHDFFVIWHKSSKKLTFDPAWGTGRHVACSLHYIMY